MNNSTVSQEQASYDCSHCDSSLIAVTLWLNSEIWNLPATRYLFVSHYKPKEQIVKEI